MQSQNYNHFGALVLCAAVSKVFPREQICFSDADGRGFSVELTYSETFQESYLPMLENTMKSLAKEKVIVREMVASNARELLQHKGHQKWGEGLQGGTVLVAEMGGFFGLCTGEFEPCDYFSLYQFTQSKKRVIIEGMAFPSADLQKTFLKKFRQYPKKCFEHFAKELDLIEGEIWLRRGMALRRVLVELWRKWLEGDGYYEISSPDLSRKKFSCWVGPQDRSYCFSENCLISSLQFIQKWINIFNFESKWVLVKPTKALKDAITTCGIDGAIEDGDEPRVELRIADALGRYWTGPTLWLKKKGIEFSLFGDLERFIALLVEKTEGEFPFWLAPEQVRLLPMEGVDIEPLVKIFDRQNIRFFVDAEPVLLKEKMHRALRAKVPYVMVFGKREENSKRVNIRASGQDQAMTMEQLEQMLAERKLENQ
ncbi:MAG: hypothetical protein JSS30_07925 [Verrucomicrobia bacterium]|nr:hypothetical protein [Verrucomicrobiota bacterium]